MGVSRLSVEQQLDLISKAWGKQQGYCVFPVISGKATCRAERIEAWREGPAFMWPDDRDKILQRMRDHLDDDLYWCPSLFEHPRRQMEVAMDEHCLWADLDETDPRTIADYPPSMAWETSPGRYQAVWLLQPGSGDLQGASWQGGENQRLTYYVGADPGGWDTTQALRIPGWLNHKPEHRGGTREGPNRKLGPPIRGKLLWRSGRRYLPDDFEDLPELPRAGEFEHIIEDQIEAVDPKAVWRRVRLKCSRRTRELVAAREADSSANAEGRSGVLWEIERDLADAGCTAVEIVSVVRDTVWNKYQGRADELKRLTIEAGKAIDARAPETEAKIEADREDKPKPIRLAEAVKSVKPPRWLIEGVWTEGACGFLAGQPKSFKTWCGLDMALAVSSGAPFLDRFRVTRPGPVLYVQEEDGLPMVKARYDKVWPGKQADRLVVEQGDGESLEVFWLPPRELSEPDVVAAIGYGFTLSDPAWQAWLDEVLEEGLDGEPFRMMVLDPLMMIAGDVQENQASDTTERLYKPLKQLSRKHETAVVLVHHMRKASGQGQAGERVRGGQLMLGSVANHAWAEDALYVRLDRGGVEVELESKSAPSTRFRITNLRNRSWSPVASEPKGLIDDELDDREGEREDRQDRSRESRSKARKESPAMQALRSLGQGSWTTAEIHAACAQLGHETGRSSIYQQLKRLEATGSVEKIGQKWGVS